MPEGYATGAAKGLTTADLPDHAYWEKWFPADWVSEMREQIRLWFYSQHFMSVALTGRAPYRRVLGYEKMLDENGREMHGSWGNMIDADDAFARMGADVMRWQYCSQPPNQNLLFGFGPAHEIQRRLLTLWNSCKFLVDYANVEGWAPEWTDLADGPAGELEPLDRWLVERTRALVAEATAGYESWLTVDVVRAYEAFVDDVSNWYIRRSRRRFWDGDPVALRTLWYALVQGLRVVAPLMPFLTDHLWRVPDRALRGGARLGPPRGLARDDGAGRGAPRRDRRAPPRGRARSPGARDLGREAPPAAARARRRGRAARESHADEIADELRVREVSFGHVEASELRVKPNLPVLGPKLGKELGAVRAALQTATSRSCPTAASASPVTTSRATRSSSSARGRTAGRSQPPTGSPSRSTFTSTTTSLRAGRVYDLIHAVNTMRKEPGLELTDRIRLTIPEADSDLLEHREWIARETLAVSVDAAAAELASRRRVAREELPAFLTPPETRPSRRAALARAALGLRGELELAAELDRKAEGDVLLDDPIRLDVARRPAHGTSRRRGSRASPAPTRRT